MILEEFPWGDSMGHATDISKLRELTDDELSAVGGGSAAWGGVGAVLSWCISAPAVVVGIIVVAYLVSPGTAE